MADIRSGENTANEDTIPDNEVTIDAVKSLLSSINAEMKEQGIKFRALVDDHTILQNQMLLQNQSNFTRNENTSNSNIRDSNNNRFESAYDDAAAYNEHFRYTPRRQPEITSRDQNSNVTNRRSTNSFCARDRDTNEHDSINPPINFRNQNIHSTTSPNRTEFNPFEERFPFTRNTTRTVSVNIIQSVVDARTSRIHHTLNRRSTTEFYNRPREPPPSSPLNNRSQSQGLGYNSQVSAPNQQQWSNNQLSNQEQHSNHASHNHCDRANIYQPAANYAAGIHEFYPDSSNDNPYHLIGKISDYVNNPLNADEKHVAHIDSDNDLYAHNLSITDARNLPCFEKLKTGNCTASRDKPCMCNHDTKVLTQVSLAQQQILLKSPCNPSITSHCNDNYEGNNITLVAMHQYDSNSNDDCTANPMSTEQSLPAKSPVNIHSQELCAATNAFPDDLHENSDMLSNGVSITGNTYNMEKFTSPSLKILYDADTPNQDMNIIIVDNYDNDLNIFCLKNSDEYSRRLFKPGIILLRLSFNVILDNNDEKNLIMYDYEDLSTMNNYRVRNSEKFPT
jgi:hypothetical protein